MAKATKLENFISLNYFGQEYRDLDKEQKQKVDEKLLENRRKLLEAIREARAKGSVIKVVG